MIIGTRLKTAGLIAVVALTACEKLAGTPPATAIRHSQISTNHELGRQVYNFRCYYCHGYSGDARTLAATFLKPAPRNFKDSLPADLTRDIMIDAVTQGRTGTAMQSFAGTLTTTEVSAVVDFILQEFTIGKAHNTRYHTEANGWRDHERFKIAFPFATGQIALDTSTDTLSADERRGKHLFMNACISCHDRARVDSEGSAWSIRPVTYPPDFYLLAESGQVKDGTDFDPHHAHEKPPSLLGLTKIEKRGERIYQKNCAFCHAADGTGRNWIGSFLEPNASDLTAKRANAKDPKTLAAIIAHGIEGSSMPAWKNVLDKAEIDDVVAYVRRAFSKSVGSGTQHL